MYWAAGRGRPPEAAARRAGLEFVEKLLTKLTSTDMTERNAGMVLLVHPRPAPPHRWSSWLLTLAPCRPGRRRHRPAQTRPQLVGHDLDHGPGAAILSGQLRC